MSEPAWSMKAGRPDRTVNIEQMSREVAERMGKEPCDCHLTFRTPEYHGRKHLFSLTDARDRGSTGRGEVMDHLTKLLEMACPYECMVPKCPCPAHSHYWSIEERIDKIEKELKQYREHLGYAYHRLHSLQGHVGDQPWMECPYGDCPANRDALAGTGEK